MGKPGVVLPLGGAGRNMLRLCPSPEHKGALSLPLTQRRTAGILAGSSHIFKGLSFYAHFIRSLSAFQG